MASFKQTEYCPTCKKTVTSKGGLCKLCGGKVDKGSWFVRFRVIEGGIEKNKSLSGYQTKKDANQAYIDYMSEYNAIEQKYAQKDRTAYDMTINELYSEYKRYNEHQIKESSFLVATERIENFIIPYFGSIKIDKITVKDIADWKMNINNMTYTRNNITRPYSWKYKNAAYSCFVHLLNFAKKYYNLLENIVSKEGPFSKKSEMNKSMKYWLPSEFNLFYNAMLNNEKQSINFTITVYRLYFLTLYLSGCRKGESSALTWNDIDFEKNTINFAKTASRRNKEGIYKITSPKTNNSYRKINMPQYYMDYMLAFKQTQMRESSFKESDFVWFSNRIIPEQSVLNYFNKYIKIAGVKKIRIHDLRHSHVSLLLHIAGYDLSMIYVIANRIGDTPEQILKTYGHMFPSKQEEVLRALNTQVF